MNRVFKSVWNTTTSSWVAVSELGKSQGKKNSKSSLALASIALLGALSLTPAHAGNIDTNGSDGGFGTETTANWDLTTPNIDYGYSGTNPTTWIQGDYLNIYGRPGALNITAGAGLSPYGIQAYNGVSNVIMQGADLDFYTGNNYNFIYVSGGATLDISNNITAHNMGLYGPGLTLRGNTTLTGNTSIYYGDISLLGASTIDNLNLNGYKVTTGTETVSIHNVSGNGTLELGGDVVITQDNGYLDASTTGSGRLVKEGSSILNIDNATLNRLQHTGGMKINGVDGIDGAGGVMVYSDRNDGTGKILGATELDGGSLYYNSDGDLNGNIYSTDTITGVGTIVHIGNSTLTLDGGVNTTNNLDATMGRNIVGLAGSTNIYGATVSNSGNNASSIVLQSTLSTTTDNTINNSIISTSGVNSHGVELFANNASVNTGTYTGNNITTTGNSSHGMILNALADSTIVADTAQNTVSTSGEGSVGVNLQASGDRAFISTSIRDNSQITTSGINSDGVVANTNGTTNTAIQLSIDENTMIETTGLGSSAVSLSGSGANLIANQSTFIGAANGLQVRDGASASLTNMTISSTANQIFSGGYAGVSVSSENVNALSGLFIDNSEIETTGDQTVGAISGKGSLMNLNVVNITTSGVQSHALVSGGSSITNVEGSTLTTSGEGAIAAYAQDGGNLSILTSTLKTSGNDAVGLAIISNTSNTTTGSATNTDISTSGSGSHAVVVSGISSYASANLSNVNLSTTGEGAVAVASIGSANIYMNGTNSLSTTGVGANVMYATQGAQINMQDATMTIHEGQADTATLHATDNGFIYAGNTAFIADITSAKGITAVADGGYIFLDNGTSGVKNTLADNNGTILVGTDVNLQDATLVSRNGGYTQLVDNAMTDSSTRVVLDNGYLDVVGKNTPTDIGSVSGTGDIYIGEQTLSLGSANLDDTLVGNIVANNYIPSFALTLSSVPISLFDGGLTKVGTGTLTLAGTANSYSGDTVVAQGTLRTVVSNNLSQTSIHKVLTEGTLDLAGTNQTLLGLENAGTVSLVGANPGSELTVTSAYVGNNGTLKLGTTLGDSTSVSDKLVLDGAAASALGHTNIQVVNQNGLGALTTGDGIEVVAARNGATTTAQTTKDAFSLQGGHVDAGAYEYRLKPGTSNESWYLSSTTPAVPVEPTPPVVIPTEPGVEPTPPATPTAPVVEVPTYRAEVPMIAALPTQVHQSNLAMLGSMRVRQGDNGTRKSAPVNTAKAESGDTVAVELAAATQGAERQAWGRAITADMKLGQNGSVNPSSDGSVNGFQAGTDIWVSPSADWKVGAYFGQLNGKVRVNGFSSGIANNYSGNTDLKSKFFGAYATYQNADGLYVDNVLQYSRHDNTLKTVAGNNVSSKADGILASVEVGKSFPVSENWSLEPQAQLIYEKNSFDDIQLGTTTVSTDSNGVFTGRVGLRLKGDINTTNGLVQPYGRVSLYKSSNSNSTNTYSNAAANTTLGTPNGSSYSEVAVGAVWNIQPTVALYGEVSQLNRIGGSSATRSATQGSVGVKVSW